MVFQVLKISQRVKVNDHEHTMAHAIAMTAAAEQAVAAVNIAAQLDRMMRADGSFHIAAYKAKMIHENLEWIIVMLKYLVAVVEVRKMVAEMDRVAVNLVKIVVIPRSFDTSAAFKEAFEVFSNKVICGSSSAELLATFSDNILNKGGSEKLSDEAIEDTPEKDYSAVQVHESVPGP
ncbi:hypothetical protein CTI12_AA418490 [Artemisia annua]|uniref:Uncharacterized protein n=1 Tax=Artemisia annua TaxID=35608 RepID=A0A2U1M5D7_ARTAN|nr:hypothetical protein CTI12_AA418490 [Artemisia annua]